MIRVDLGKDEVQRKKSPLAKLLQGLTRKKKSGGGGGRGGVRRWTKAVKGSVLLTIAIAVALVPQFVLAEYKSFIREQSNREKAKLEEQLKALNQELIKRAPLERELKSYQRQKELVQGKIEIVRKLLASRGTPVNVMDAVGQSLPKMVWLESIDLVRDSSNNTLDIKGKAISNDQISDYVARLSESVHLSDVTLTRVDTARTDSVEVKEFQISAKPKVTYPAAPRQSGEGSGSQE